MFPSLVLDTKLLEDALNYLNACPNSESGNDLILNLVNFALFFFFLPVLSLCCMCLIVHSTQIRDEAGKREASVDFIVNYAFHEIAERSEL